MHSVHPVPAKFAASANVTQAQYEERYAHALADPTTYWGTLGENVEWMQPYTQVKDVSYDVNDFRIRWYADGVLNVSANCLDRHLAERGDQTAFIFEGIEPGNARHITYRALHAEVCKFANVLKSIGVTRGDRVTIYLPVIPEAAVAMLACARIGAVHSVVFGGFAPESLSSRIVDCSSAFVITADEAIRQGKTVALKDNVDIALTIGAAGSVVKKVVVIPNTGATVNMTEGRDLGYQSLMAEASAECAPEPMNAEDPLFILYTSGSTGKPKGVLHTTGGYLVWATHTFSTVFDYKQGDIFWCTADVGWVTGHSYVVYGPLSNGATAVMFDFSPFYPNPGRCWDVIDRHGVTIFYTAPTALRALMREGDAWVTQHSRKTLRLLGSVGEPIGPEAWEWYHRVVGDNRCPIVDTWWQTETGGLMIAPLPGATALKPGSATRPLVGVQPALLSADGEQLEGVVEGNLVILDSWPGQMRTLYGDHQRFLETYFTMYPGTYFTGDGARRDKDGYYWITGRVDDVLNVSGHRLSTTEIENAIASHHSVCEVAAVGRPHDIKGQGIYVFVTLLSGVDPTDKLLAQLRARVRTKIGPFATPEVIQWAPALPKTRSGKIMRRILRKIAANELDQIGDVSTLANPAAVQEIINYRPKS